jgi:hypothetical protein
MKQTSLGCAVTTAIVISLHYETHAFVKCRNLWQSICERMSDAGFTRKGNRFVAVLDVDRASRSARRVLDGIESEYCARGQSAWEYIRDFYAVPEHAIVDLALPTTHAIEVDLMATGAFQTFFR